MRQAWLLFLWTTFFSTPIFWPAIVDSYIAMDLLALTAGLTASAMMVKTRSNHASQTDYIFLFLLLFPIFIQLLFLNVPNPWRAFQMALYYSSAWLIYRMAKGSARDLLGGVPWSVLFTCIGICYVIFATIQDFYIHPLGDSTFPIWQPQATRFGGPLIQTNMEGLLLVLVVITVWSRGISEKLAWPWLLASILPCAGLLATSSRGSFITLTIGVLALLYLTNHRMRSLLYISAAFASALLLTAYWNISHETIAATTLFQRFETGGFMSRLFIWDMSWRLFLEHSWFGIGAGNLISYGTEIHLATLNAHPEWQQAATSLSGGHSWTHNIILQFLVDLGIFGGIFILTLIFLVLKKFNKLCDMQKQHLKLTSGQVQGVIGLVLMIAHGMVSVAIMQGFFFVLFALYGAAVFAKSSNTLIQPNYRLLLYIPALLVFFNWQQYVSKSIAMERGLGYPVLSQEFLQPVLNAVNYPWTSRPALERYFANLAFNNAKPSLWIASENMAYRYWIQHQSELSLRYLILISHLKNDSIGEAYWMNLYEQAYPNRSNRNHFLNHMEVGHTTGEKLDIWQ